MAWFSSQGNILSNIQGSCLQDYMLLFFWDDRLVICRHPRDELRLRKFWPNFLYSGDFFLHQFLLFSLIYSENVRPKITIQNITKYDAVRLSGKCFVREKRPLLLWCLYYVGQKCCTGSQYWRGLFHPIPKISWPHKSKSITLCLKLVGT